MRRVVNASDDVERRFGFEGDGQYQIIRPQEDSSNANRVSITTDTVRCGRKILPRADWAGKSGLLLILIEEALRALVPVLVPLIAANVEIAK